MQQHVDLSEYEATTVANIMAMVTLGSERRHMIEDPHDVTVDAADMDLSTGCVIWGCRDVVVNMRHVKTVTYWILLIIRGENGDGPLDELIA